MIGQKGKISEVDRVIEIKMYDNYFTPSKLEISKNETIKFVVHNVGDLVHEFNIATKNMHIKHQSEMALLVEKEILLANKIDYHILKRIKGNLRLSSMLHDVGKIAVSDLILKKPTTFTDDERKTMKLHTVWGAQLFQNSNSQLDEMSALISLHHHENWDGSGYPGNLVGTYDINGEVRLGR